MIYSIIPEYVEGLGDCCRVLREDGETLYHKKLDPVLREIFYERCIDLRAVKMRCRKALNQRNLIPLYLSHEEVLLPFRARKPRLKKDSGYGYVNFLLIEKLFGKRIILKGETNILFMDSQRNLDRRIKMAERISHFFDCKNDSLKRIKGDLKSNATREDMAIILREIIDIKRQLLNSI